MKKSIFIIIGLTIFLNSYSQLPKNSSIVPQGMINKLNVDASKASLDLYLIYTDPSGEIAKEKLKSTEKLLLDFDEYMKSPTSSNKILFKTYQKRIEALIHNMKSFFDINTYLYEKFPIKFIKYKNNSLAALFTGICSSDTYNTFKLTSRQRASKVITSMVLPVIKLFNGYFDSEIKYYGVSVCYTCKDFSSESASTYDGEVLYFISPTQIIKKFKNGDITEDEIVQKSDIFIYDNESLGLKKVKITLE